MPSNFHFVSTVDTTLWAKNNKIGCCVEHHLSIKYLLLRASWSLFKKISSRLWGKYCYSWYCSIPYWMLQFHLSFLSWLRSAQFELPDNFEHRAIQILVKIWLFMTISLVKLSYRVAWSTYQCVFFHVFKQFNGLSRDTPFKRYLKVAQPILYVIYWIIAASLKSALIL